MMPRSQPPPTTHGTPRSKADFFAALDALDDDDDDGDDDETFSHARTGRAASSRPRVATAGAADPRSSISPGIGGDFSSPPAARASSVLEPRVAHRRTGIARGDGHRGAETGHAAGLRQSSGAPPPNELAAAATTRSRPRRLLSVHGSDPLTSPLDHPMGASATERALPQQDPGAPTTLVLKNSAGVESMLGKRRRIVGGKSRGARTTTGTVSGASTTSMAGGRFEPSKRGASLHGNRRGGKVSAPKLVPEAQRIFAGLGFVYVPNDEKAALRRLRIARAREHGATWLREETTANSPRITHIIVDAKLTYADAKTYLEGLGMWNDDAIVVNEDYPLRCMEKKCLLEPRQEQYVVPGCPEIRERPDAGGGKEDGPVAIDASSQQSDISLQVKPVRSKRAEVGLDATPSQDSGMSEPTKGFATQSQEVRPMLGSDGIDHTGNVALKINSFSRTRSDLAREVTDQASGPDALAEMIKEAQATNHLPLDDNEDERPTSRDEPASDSGSEQDRPRSRHSKQTSFQRSKGADAPENFACMRGGLGATGTSNPNDGTIKILQEMADFYDRNGDAWRTRAYRIAIGMLRRQTERIVTSDAAYQIKGIGRRLADKIEEICVTNKLARLDYAKSEPGYQHFQLFMGIYGVSTTIASHWVAKGHRTFDDLRKHEQLSANQLVGITHYDDFQTRSPREEVAALGEIVRSAAEALDPQVQIIVGGSYRRGASTSGDIDCIITRPGTTSSSDIYPLLMKLVGVLEETGFLVWTLAGPHDEQGTKWHGCCVLPDAQRRQLASTSSPDSAPTTATPPGIWRRIDLLLVPASELGAALIYFTGDDIFNRSIRLLASRKGMRLNQRGLYKDVLRGPGRVKLTEGTLVEGADERALFRALGVPWRPPCERICH